VITGNIGILKPAGSSRILRWSTGYIIRIAEKPLNLIPEERTHRVRLLVTYKVSGTCCARIEVFIRQVDDLTFITGEIETDIKVNFTDGLMISDIEVNTFILNVPDIDCRQLGTAGGGGRLVLEEQSINLLLVIFN